MASKNLQLSAPHLPAGDSGATAAGATGKGAPGKGGAANGGQKRRRAAAGKGADRGGDDDIELDLEGGEQEEAEREQQEAGKRPKTEAAAEKKAPAPRKGSAGAKRPAPGPPLGGVKLRDGVAQGAQLLHSFTRNTLACPVQGPGCVKAGKVVTLWQGARILLVHAKVMLRSPEP